jgi:hypothetical protein
VGQVHLGRAPDTQEVTEGVAIVDEESRHGRNVPVSAPILLCASARA